MLQFKEAEATVLEPDAGRSISSAPRGAEFMPAPRAAGERSLPRPGTPWLDADQHYYWRQLKDMKASAEIGLLSGKNFARYVDACAWCLANAHARSGDPIAIAAYLGAGTSFDKAMARFATAYAEQTKADWKALKVAIADGAVEAQPGARAPVRLETSEGEPPSHVFVETASSSHGATIGRRHPLTRGLQGVEQRPSSRRRFESCPLRSTTVPRKPIDAVLSSPAKRSSLTSTEPRKRRRNADETHTHRQRQPNTVEHRDRRETWTVQHNRVQVNIVGHRPLTTENHGVDSSILSLATSFFPAQGAILRRADRPDRRRIGRNPTRCRRRRRLSADIEPW